MYVNCIVVTGEYIVSPPNMVYVTTLPCKIVITTLSTSTPIVIFTVPKMLPLYFGNSCQFLTNFHKHNFWKNRICLLLVIYKQWVCVIVVRGYCDGSR